MQKLGAMDDGEDELHTQYRCSLFPIMQLFRKIKDDLTPDHKKLMRATPFQDMLIALCEGRVLGLRKKDKSMDRILATYDKANKAFKIGNALYKPTRMDVKLMFGIVDGSEAIGDMKLKRGYAYVFGPRMFGSTGKITMLTVKKKVREYVLYSDERSKEDTVKLLCLVLMQSFFLPNSSGYMPRGFLQYVDTFETMNRFDWSGKIHEYLMHSLTETWTVCSKVSGCTVFLMYALCERSNTLNASLKSRTDGSIVGLKAIPRVCKWILREAENLIMAADLASQETIQFNVGELEPSAEEVIIIDGLAEEMDEMELEAMTILQDHMIDTDRDTDMTTLQAKGDEAVQVHEVRDRHGKAVVVDTDTDEDIPWCTPSFSLGLTQDFEKKRADQVCETSNARAGNVTDTPQYVNPHSLCPDVGKEGMEPNGRRSGTLRFGIQDMDSGKTVVGNENMTPSTEYHTPHTVLYKIDDDEPEPSFAHWHALEYDTSEKDSDMTVSCVRQMQVKAIGDQNLELTNATRQLVELGRDKAMFTCTGIEPERSMNETSDTCEQVNAQIASLMAEVNKVKADTTSLVEASANADKKIEQLEYKYGRLETYCTYLEDKVDLFYSEVCKHGMDDETLISEYVNKSWSDNGRAEDVGKLRDELQERNERVKHLEQQLAKQSCVIQALRQNVGKENLNVNMPNMNTVVVGTQMADTTGGGTSTMKVYRRTKLKRKFGENNVDVVASRVCELCSNNLCDVSL